MGRGFLQVLRVTCVVAMGYVAICVLMCCYWVKPWVFLCRRLWLWNERKVTVTSRAGGVEGDPSIWPAEEKCLEAVDVLVV